MDFEVHRQVARLAQHRLAGGSDVAVDENALVRVGQIGQFRVAMKLQHRRAAVVDDQREQIARRPGRVKGSANWAGRRAGNCESRRDRGSGGTRADGG